MRTIVGKQVDTLDVFRDFVEIMKDPKAITRAHEEARREFALTEEEKTKADEARASIKKSEALSIDLDAKAIAVNSARAQNEQAEKDLDKKLEDYNRNMQDLNVKSEEVAKAHKEFLFLKDQVERQKQSVDTQSSKNESEKFRLAEMDADLRLRLKKVQLRESAADL